MGRGGHTFAGPVLYVAAAEAPTSVPSVVNYYQTKNICPALMPFLWYVSQPAHVHKRVCSQHGQRRQDSERTLVRSQRAPRDGLCRMWCYRPAPCYGNPPKRVDLRWHRCTIEVIVYFSGKVGVRFQFPLLCSSLVDSVSTRCG